MTLKDTIGAVETFHDAFGIENNHAPTVALSEKDILLRHRLMGEENDEYLEAAKNGDLVEVADALGDQLYILCGTILKHGMQHKITEVFEEIQRSNMSTGFQMISTQTYTILLYYTNLVVSHV